MGSDHNKNDNHDIAIVGMACRFPGANDYNQFWENLKRGFNSITEIPKERWDISKYYSSNIEEPNKTNSKWGGFIENFDRFDNKFFNISPREAKNMDPQQRLLLEEAWHCIEDSGINLLQLQKEKTAVYVGVMAIDYMQEMESHQVQTDSYAASGNYEGILANRLSFEFGFRGPSIAMDTACSSSLVALNEARRSLILEESQYAMVAGVSLDFNPWKYISFGKSRMLSPDGQCKTFDKDANGYVPGEGVGVLLLQPLAKAIRDKNRIYGVIKGCAVNHGGHALSLTAPRVSAQQDVILTAYQNSQIDASDISYIEAHGTGTSLGDPIEVEALTQVFRQFTGEKQFCKIGSVKTNIGHLEASAGVAGIIKVLMMMMHRQIPPSLNITTLNPIIDFENSPFKVVMELSEWEASNEKPLMAGISSFGFGGVNAHVVIEEYQASLGENRKNKNKSPYLFILSSKSIKSMQKMIVAWKKFVKDSKFNDVNPEDVSINLLKGREHFEHRSGFLYKDHQDLVAKLETMTAILPLAKKEWCIKLGDLNFTERQISTLINTQSIFKKFFERCLVLSGNDSDLKDINELIKINNQLIQFSANYSFLSLLLELGIKPKVITGEGPGQWVALVVSGVVSLEQGINVVQGKLNSEDLKIKRPNYFYFDPLNEVVIESTLVRHEYLEQLFANLNLEEGLYEKYKNKAKLLISSQFTYKKYLEEWDRILNGQIGKTTAELLGNPGKYRLLIFLVILSSLVKLNRKWGLSEKINLKDERIYEIVDLLVDGLIEANELVELFDPKKETFHEIAVLIQLRQGKRDFKKPYRYLNAHCESVEEIRKGDLWFESIGKTFLNSECFNSYGHLILGKLKNTVAENQDSHISIQLSDQSDMLQAFNQIILDLYLQGNDIDWTLFGDGKTHRKLSLPLYEFDRERFWIERHQAEDSGIQIDIKKNEVIGSKIVKLKKIIPGRYERIFSKSDEIIRDHVICGTTIVPGAMLLDLALSALKIEFPEKPISLFQVFINSPGVVLDQLKLDIEIDSGNKSFFVVDNNENKKIVLGRYELDSTDNSASIPVVLDQNSKKNIPKIYEDFNEMGYVYGDTLQVISNIFKSTNESIYELLNSGKQEGTFSGLNPYLLDGAFQAVLHYYNENHGLKNCLFVPHSFGKLTSNKVSVDRAYISLSKAKLSTASDALKADIVIRDIKGNILVEIKSMVFKKVSNNFLGKNEGALNHVENQFQNKLSDINLKNILFKPVWVKSEESINPIVLTGSIYVFSDNSKIVDHLIERFGSEKIVTILPSSNYQKVSSNLYYVNPEDESDYKKVLKNLTDRSLVLFLWGLNIPDDIDIVQKQTKIVQRQIFSLLCVGKAMANNAKSNKYYLRVVTRNLNVITGSEKINPFQAPLVGLAKVIKKENNNIDVYCVDLDGYFDERSCDILLFSEFYYLYEIAIRKMKIFVRKMEAVKNINAGMPLIKSGGVYVVFGGNGGIGTEISKMMLTKYNAKLILIGLRELSEEQKLKIGMLNELGGEVVYQQADICNKQDVNRVISYAKRKYGKINGIIHSVLLLSDSLIENMDYNNFNLAFEPKFTGSLNLIESVKNEKLDFILLFSSFLTFQGNDGQANYVSGCSFKDAIVHYISNKYSINAKVINWGYWGEVGIVANKRYREALARKGIFSLKTSDGVEAFELMLNTAEKQLMVANLDENLLAGMGADKVIAQERISDEFAHKDGNQEVDDYSLYLFVENLRKAGLFLKSNQFLSFDQIREALKLLPKYERFLSSVLSYLCDRKIFLNKNGQYCAVDKLFQFEVSNQINDLNSLKNKLLNLFPDKKHHIQLVSECGENLLKILSGRLKATEIIFPNSSMDLVKGFYNDHEEAIYFNKQVALEVKKCINRLIKSGKNKVRILEVGAGTGGTTELVLNEINQYSENIEFFFTDISLAFTKYAKAKFKETYPDIKYQVLDLEKDVFDQSYIPEQFDVVYGTNVFHATKSINNTLANINRIVSKQGALILNELIRNRPFLTMTFGLLEGWWLYEDHRLENSPLMSVDMWTEKILDGNGFFISEKQDNKNEFENQAIIMASKQLIKSQNEFGIGRHSDNANNIEVLVKKIISKHLCTDSNSLNAKRKFSELGIDSIVTVEVIQDLNKAFSLNLNPTTLYDYSTIDELVAFIEKNQSILFSDKGNSNNEMNLKKIIENLKKILAKILDDSIENIDFQRSFSEMGIDSILALDFIKVINGIFELSFPPTIIFDYMNINSLAEYILSKNPVFIVEKNHSNEKNNGSQMTQAIKEGFTINKDLSDLDFVLKEKAGKIRDAENLVAIIGISSRFPQVDTIDEYWDLICSKKSSVSEVPRSRWDVQKYYSSNENEKNKSICKWGGFLEEHDCFDPLFFNISPMEAEQMDPQQRILLEEIWKSIEDSGYSANAMSGKKCGVYIGVMNHDYSDQSLLASNTFEKNSHQLMGNSLSILASRASYFMNLKGPSIAIDTACSSSLVAMHLAIQALKNKEIEVGIVGGVTIYLGENSFILMSKAGMLSATGACKAFDNSADGFIPGEGVAVVILKSLDKAIEDGDHIYGVIRGSGINQDGSTNGITAPSSISQTELELDVYKNSNINPDSITLVEAHGTGTKLGDPIEVTALTNSFKKYTQRKQYCALGSVKSNVGHTSAAAGLAGTIKVLLAMKNRMIPPTINFNVENEHIDFKNSPFYVATELKDWIPENNFPRRASISSFGFSGTNAHVVLEEYQDSVFEARAEENAPEVFVLSAKNEERLREYAEKLKVFLEGEGSQKVLLRDIAYTFQVGREVFDERLACVVSSKEELSELLEQYLKNPEQATKVYRGNAKKNKEKENPIYKVHHKSLIRELSEYGNQAQDYFEKLQAVTELFTKGFLIDWNLLQKNRDVRRISLPTYPFARERYWIPESKAIGNGLEVIGGAKKLHPLVDANDSTLEEQAFIKNLSGEEFFLKDHVVGNAKVLPGVGYLEMARASGDLSLKGSEVIGIKNVIWAKPIVVNEVALDTRINLYPGEKAKGSVNYEISTEGGVHSQGELVYGDSGNSTVQKPSSISINEIEARCDRAVTKEEIYKYFSETGLNYGGTFQSIERLKVNAKEAIAHLKLSESIKETINEFKLHPSLMDGALQTVAGVNLFSVVQASRNKLALPFALSELRIYGGFGEECYAHARLTEDKGSTKKYDITVVDVNGAVIVEFKGFSVREMPREVLENLGEEKKATKEVLSNLEEDAKIVESELVPSIYYVPKWATKTLESAKAQELEDLSVYIEGSYENNQVLLYVGKSSSANGSIIEHKQVVRIDISKGYENKEAFGRLIDSLKTEGKEIKDVIWNIADQFGVGTDNLSNLNEATVEAKLNQGLYGVFHLTQALIDSKPKNKISLVYLHSGSALDEAVSGFAKTVRLENPKFEYRVIGLPESIQSNQLQGIVARELNEISYEIARKIKAELDVRYVKSNENDLIRETKRIVSLESNQSRVSEISQVGLKQGGTYLITGGAGGLGLIFAKHFSEKYKAQLILTGRKKIADLDEKTQKALDEVNQLGGHAVYVEADVSNYDSLKQAIANNHLDGIIHAAGVIKDAFVIKKSFEQFREVISPKIKGTINLTRAISELKFNPDFVILFSSVSSIMGNLGQSDYASGNAFMDAVANDFSTKTVISVNWPLWRNGGMQIDKDSEEMLLKSTGMVPLETAKGIQALEDAITQTSSNYSEVIVLDGDTKKIDSLFGITRESDLRQTKNTTQIQSNRNVENAQDFVSKTLREDVEKDLINLMAEILKVKVSDMDVDADIAEYGVDSILMMQILNQLEKHYGKPVEPGVLIENPRISALAGYMVENGFVKSEARKVNQPSSVTKSVMANASMKAPRRSNRTNSRFMGNMQNNPVRKIAVVSVAGRFPQANDIEGFWNNLKQGINSISEVPSSRFDIAPYFDADKKADGKSYSKWAGFMEQVDGFDANFFGISDSDAIVMDPQHRILLELTQELFDRAGYLKNEVKGKKIGIFIGGADSGYVTNNIDKLTDQYRSHMVVNMIQNMMAARISDFYDLKGPASTVDTACSSALVAMHNACQSIVMGESEMAIAGGIQVLIDPQGFIGFSKAQTLSTDGKSYVFDERANGFVLGEGAGLVLLKPLEKAEADGDQILGVILGSAINNDGHTMGLTTPNMEAQKDVIETAVQKAQIDPTTITYLEAHGTGTLLGDPIEIKAASQVYRNFTDKKQYCAVGSVKSNIGHLLHAAGVASFIKVILAFQNKQIPASLNCENPHPRFKFEESPFYPNTIIKDWTLPEDIDVRRAAISSFGFGGTNCHLILEEYDVDKSGYVPVKERLPLTQFDHKKYWLGKNIQKSDTNLKEKKEADKVMMDILDQIEEGLLTPEEAVLLS